MSRPGGEHKLGETTVAAKIICFFTLKKEKEKKSKWLRA